MCNIILKSSVAQYKCVCLLHKRLSPSVLCFRHLGPYLMFITLIALALLNTSASISLISLHHLPRVLSPLSLTVLIYLMLFFPPLTDALQPQLTFLLSLGAVVRSTAWWVPERECSCSTLGELDIWCSLAWELAPPGSLCNLGQL